MILNRSSKQQRLFFLAIILAIMAGYAEREAFKLGIRPSIRPFWPDWSGTASQSGIPQQIPQSLRDSGNISEAT
jgi:hypothetical protein